MRVRTLLEMPELRLTVRSGEGLLDRAVTSVYGTELLDPGRFLGGGEIVVSGLLWWRGPADADTFVRALAEHGVAALAASGPDGIPDALVAACHDHGVPLLEVPPDLSFAVITERVVLAIAAARTGHGPALRQRLLSTVTGGGGLPALLAGAAHELGMRCWVLSATGRLVAGTEDLPDDLLGAARRTRTQPYAVLPVPGRSARVQVPWFLAVHTGPEGWRREHRDLAEEIASLAGLERASADHGRLVDNRAAGPLLRLVSAGSPTPAALRARLTAAGLPADGDFLAIVARTDGATGLLDEVLAELGAAGVVGDLADDALAVVASAPADVTARVRAVIAALEPTPTRVLVGVSVSPDAAGLPGAVQEARQALRLGEHRPGAIQVVDGQEIAVHQLLLAGLSTPLRTALRRRLLGPVLDYDVSHGSDLVESLRTFLDCAGSWTTAAGRLHVHVNTLRYRIAKIEQLTGLDLDEFANRVDLFLVLDAQR